MRRSSRDVQPRGLHRRLCNRLLRVRRPQEAPRCHIDDAREHSPNAFRAEQGAHRVGFCAADSLLHSDRVLIDRHRRASEPGANNGRARVANVLDRDCKSDHDDVLRATVPPGSPPVAAYSGTDDGRFPIERLGENEVEGGAKVGRATIGMDDSGPAMK